MLGGLIAALQRQPPSAPAATRRPSSERAEDASHHLAPLLADSDVAAIAFLRESSEELRNTLGNHFDAVERATESFDFAAALQRLQRAASDREIALQP